MGFDDTDVAGNIYSSLEPGRYCWPRHTMSLIQRIRVQNLCR
jgi:hypothetical protein